MKKEKSFEFEFLSAKIEGGSNMIVNLQYNGLVISVRIYFADKTRKNAAYRTLIPISTYFVAVVPLPDDKVDVLYSNEHLSDVTDYFLHAERSVGWILDEGERWIRNERNRIK